MASRPRLVCVTGADGSGKTTQIVRLAERLARRERMKVAAVTVWDLLLDPAAQGSVPFKGPREVDRYLGILHPTARALFIYHCFYQALELAKRRDPEVLLVNAYWYKYYATEVAHGGDADVLLRLAGVFEEPEITFFLRVSVEEALRRKTEPSAYECGFPEEPGPEAFAAFQRRAHAALDALAAGRGFVELSGAESPDAITDLIVARLR